MSGYNRNSNRVNSTNIYVHDAWKARYCPSRSPPSKEIRCSSYLGGSNHQSTFLDSHSRQRQRSPSPNLPRIPYLHKGNQRYYPSPPRYTLRKPKVKHQSILHNVSRKSIPEHVLMKSLLSGLEDFTSKDLRASQVRPKSMGNITTGPPNYFQADPPNKSPKSQLDFSKAPPIEFKPNFRKYVDDDDAVYKSETSCLECIKERRRASTLRKSTPHVIQPRINEKNQKCTCCPECLRFQEIHQRRPKNLVAQRTQFFESQIKPPKTQKNKNEEVTEIYRNFKSVFSASTLSKRSSSVPPCVLKTLPRNSDLFNPDYNFNHRTRKSLIDSIRSKIFHSNSDREDWGSCKLPKFPKETRRAMSIILSNRNSSLSCRICQRKLNTGDVSDMETQTTPVESQQKFWNPRRDSSKIPCTKNLLCNRGLHTGQCEENLRQKLKVVCAEDCVCRNRRRMMHFDQLIFPSRKLNKKNPRRCQSEEKTSEESLLGILKWDLEDEGHSRINSQCESCVRDDQLVFTPQQLNQISTLRCQSESKSSEESLLGILKFDLEDEGHSRTSSECEGCIRGKLEDVR